MATNITLTNIVDNGNRGYFAATRNNCSWQSTASNPGDGARYSVKIIPTSSGEVTLTSANHSLYASHKYYLSFKVRFETSVDVTFDWYWPVAEPAAVSGLRVNSAADTWTRVSAVFDRTSFSDGSYPCRFDYNNEGNVAVWFTSCMLIDLTASFGAGKEPSKEWMDKHVTAFADSQEVQYIENLGELFKGIASAIRAKSGQTGEIFACDFEDRIRAL